MPRRRRQPVHHRAHHDGVTLVDVKAAGRDQCLLGLVDDAVALAFDQLDHLPHAGCRRRARSGSGTRSCTRQAETTARVSVCARRLLQLRQRSHPGLRFGSLSSAGDGSPDCRTIVIHQTAGLGRGKQPLPDLLLVKQPGITLYDLIDIVGAKVERRVAGAGRRAGDLQAFPPSSATRAQASSRFELLRAALARVALDFSCRDASAISQSGASAGSLPAVSSH